MNNKLEEMMTRILNKKFNVGIRSGYDPEDVDEFFDYVISYLKNVDSIVGGMVKEKGELLEQIEKLQLTVESKVQNIKMLDEEINQFKREGYNNQRMQEEMKMLKDKVKDLEKK